MSIISNLITLEDIVEKNYFFKVPIYQRLYVWEDKQITTLLEDLLTAYLDKKSIFYLGGVLTVEYDGECFNQSNCFDLIDGQQRFTTLWMMSIVFSLLIEDQSNGFPTFRYQYDEDGNYPRIEFSIRPQANHFFTELMELGHSSVAIDDRIGKALKLMQTFVDTQSEKNEGFELESFMDFIYTKVQMVMTQVPAHTDLNKLFEVINNRGVQLQHHEILKAKLLAKLVDSDRDKYAVLWDACSYMDQYLEKNIRDIAGVKISKLFRQKQSKKDEESIADAGEVLKEITEQQNVVLEEPLSLEKIIKEKISIDESGGSTDTEEYEADNVRSIISFPMLLEHTLRIWLSKKGYPDISKILDKELLSIFDDHFFVYAKPDDMREFIEYLWEVRYIFDKYIIKWVSVGEEEHHLICKLRLNQSNKSVSLIREQPKPSSNSGFALLQSMLYHSQQITTHYWLTPLLSYIYDNPGKKPYRYLRHLDTHLLCSNDSRPLIERTWEFMQEYWTKKELDLNQLSEPLGVQLPHYWFYKLEFVLWYCKRKSIGDQRWNEFRITAKNSIEHISPQTQQSVDKETVSKDVLDTFGNLSLVSRSINSEYGNKPFNEKRQHFWNHNTIKLDSLKMYIIYNNKHWNDDLAKEHQDKMIALLQTYMNNPEECINE